MAQRTYAQYCGVARALDLVGERWTVLVLRELLLGPRRFGDLLEGLPGVGTGLLTARLRALEGEGLITRRRLPPPAGSAVYELTEAGREFEPVLVALARFGTARLEEPRPGDAVHARWAMLAMASFYDRAAAAGVRERYEFAIDGEVFHADVDDGRLEVRDGPVEDPAVRIETDAHTWARLVHDPTVARPELSVTGERAAVRRCLRIFAPTLRPRVA